MPAAKCPPALRSAREVPLSEEAWRRRLSYNQLLRLVLLGKVKGRKADGRWLVEISEQISEPV